MNDGVIQQVGTPKHLYEQPANLFVANFLGTANILEGRIVGRWCVALFRGIRRLAHAGAAECADTRRGADGVSAAGCGHHRHAMRLPVRHDAPVSGTVAYREFLGASVRYGVRAGAANIAVDSPFHAGDMLYEVGASVTVAVAIGSVRWLSD